MLPLDVTNTGLRFFDGWLGLSEIIQDDLLSRSHFSLLDIKNLLKLEGGGLALLCLLLISEHALQLLICLCALAIKLRRLLRKADTEVADFVHGILELLQTSVEMTLLLFEVLSLLIVELDVLSHKVEEVARG
jgi:hypothetical protein